MIINTKTQRREGSRSHVPVPDRDTLRALMIRVWGKPLPQNVGLYAGKQPCCFVDDAGSLIVSDPCPAGIDTFVVLFRYWFPAYKEACHPFPVREAGGQKEYYAVSVPIQEEQK